MGMTTMPAPLRQSVAAWCFARGSAVWTLDQVAAAARRTGCSSVELLLPDEIPTVARHGLTCALTQVDLGPYPPFAKGFNNPRYRAEVLAATRRAIAGAAANGSPNVIAFTGMRQRDLDDPTAGDIPDDEGLAECITGLTEVARDAERAGVNVCLEMLNTVPDQDPMKGHPGYHGDALEWCAQVVRGVGSPRVKLLFDAYHVQLMQGNLCNRIRAHGDLIGHVHVAGCPGRGNLDDAQEIHFPGVIAALQAVGYDGYIGHEFIPTGDAEAALAQAVAACGGRKNTP